MSANYFCNDCGIRFEKVLFVRDHRDGTNRDHVQCSTCKSSKVELVEQERRPQTSSSGVLVGDSFAGVIDVGPSHALPADTPPSIPAGEEFLTKP